MNSVIKEWAWFEGGKAYNRNLPIPFYDLVDTNWDFFYGDQWSNAGLNEDLPQPVFNNINRFVTFFVANILASRVGVDFKSPIKADRGVDRVLNKSWAEFAERVKLDYNTKTALYDGAITGDYVGHLILNPDARPYGGAYSDVEGEIDFELVDPNNFYVANPNKRDVQGQKWIQIYGRDLVSSLKDEQKEQSEIQPDNDTEEQAGHFGDIEMDGIDGTEKAGYVITYQKKKVTVTDADGNEREETHVFATKCTQDAYIYKDVDLGFSRYPVAHSNWELQRNTFHGMSFVTALIPTQIFINRGFAMAMMHVMNSAFPKLIYDKNRMAGFSNKVNAQIGVDLRPGESISNLAGYLNAGNMSSDVIAMIDLAQTFMKDVVGASDALLGSVNPEEASGVSIAVASKQAGIPLENPRANLYNWVEDIARNYHDMVANLYGLRPVIIDEEIIDFDFSVLKDGYREITVDVGAASYWTELAVIQTLDNLLDRQLIEFIDYLKRLPEGYIEDRDELIAKAEARLTGGNAEQDIMAQLSEEERARFEALPDEEKQKAIQEYQMAMQRQGELQQTA